MSRVLVAYGTKHGATREIAEAITDELRRAGHDVDCIEADAATGIDNYDAGRTVGQLIKQALPDGG